RRLSTPTGGSRWPPRHRPGSARASSRRNDTARPPATSGGSRPPRSRRLVRGADHHVSRVPADVVNPRRDGAAQRPTGEVIVEDLPAVAPPAAAGVLERADQLLLLGIDADDGQAPRQIPAPDPGQVAELPVPVGVARPGQALAVGPQGEALL